MSRRSGSSDPSRTAWRIRQIAGPDLALRYLQGQHEPAASPAAAPAPASVPAPAPAAALPADPMRALFEQLRGEFDTAKPSLSFHESTQVGGLFGRIEGLMGARAAQRNPFDLLAEGGEARRLILQGEHLVRNAGVGAAGTDANRADRVIAALAELKFMLLGQGLHPEAGPASLAAATSMFTRLGRLTKRWQDSPGDAEAWALVERDEARPLAVDVLDFLRARHAYLAKPVWPGALPPVDASTLFYSGGEASLTALRCAARRIGMKVDPPAPPGADFAAQRWRSLRRASVAVFDLAGAAPKVFYELGMALASGAQLVLLAPHGSVVPFDVAQVVTRYADARDLEQLLPDAIDGACYQVQVCAPRRVANVDALTKREALCLGISKVDGAAVLCSRWRYRPESATPRWFAVMPLRAGPNARWALMARRLRSARPDVLPIRGDGAQGQEVIASIWDELCQATHISADLSGLNPNVCLELGVAHVLGRPTLLIGEAGTAARLGAELPGAAKWRCHEYGAGLGRSFSAALDRFFAAG